MKYIQTIPKDRKCLLLALPMAVLLMASVFFASRHDGGRAAAAVMPASPEATAAVDGKTARTPLRDEAIEKASITAQKPKAAETAETAATAEAASTRGAAEPVKARAIGSGEASYYGRRFAGRPTASGETFNPGELTAAHKTLPFGSRVRVTNVDNGQSVVVRVNDRGPYVHGRLIDVSRRAAEVLGIISRGTANVRLELLSKG